MGRSQLFKRLRDVRRAIAYAPGRSMRQDRIAFLGNTFMPHHVAAALKLCLAALLTFTGGACRESPPAATVDPTLRIGFGMGAAARLTTMSTMARILYAEPLVAYSWDGRLVERLADSQEWIEDEENPATYRLHVRPGIKLHNGQPLTATVVIAVLQKEVDRRRQAGSLGGFQYLERISPSVGKNGAPIENSVDLKLSRRDWLLVGDLAGIMMTDPTNRDIGTGPFRLLTNTTKLVEAERSPDYYRGRSAIHRVRIESFETQRMAWAALLRGDVDVVQEVHRDSVEFLQKNREIRAYSSLKPFYIPLVFNLRHPVLRDVAVRRALSEAVDREEIVRDAMRGRGQIADDPISPTHWAFSATAHSYVCNPAAARLRLEAARLPIRKAPGGSRMASRFRFTCLFWKEDPQYERIALFLQRQLAEVGVDMELEPVDLMALGERTRLGNFDAYLASANAGRSLDVIYRYWRSPTGAIADVQDGGYHNADAILDRLRFETLDDAGIRAVIADLRQRFREDAPAVFIAWTETTRAVDAGIDVGDPKDPDSFTNLWKWRPARQNAAR
jgi:peptide/nickel transport system substrate-binding protein